mmetsp:Transcript_16080/g.24235  ORF Transcript_16080/g.24235 Transcript_16080/m.24235 type:complete len:724 (-) Transcript_16080:152-2323(-)|eukprot:CAMPEP_0167745694 /NCGR_PEP_ID=MMETSP0110_2-20121227/3295_1 /TAXON_ID=629695 /ORGANISM="Gymnochlora sp., Strain CCMP2014" /LENGTH=723 /DNA_ID=CAMNT_0007630367 /DNA_START=30 /DNA_END=2201 /DNA_ORIENTATION=+
MPSLISIKFVVAAALLASTTALEPPSEASKVGKRMAGLRTSKESSKRKKVHTLSGDLVECDVIPEQTTAAFWFRTDSLSGTSDNTNVTSWDQEGFAITNAYADAGYEPSYSTSVTINGHPVIDFLETSTSYLRFDQFNEVNNVVTTERIYAFAFRTGGDVNTRQVLWKEGGSQKGFTMYIVNSVLYFGGRNKNEGLPGSPWGFIYASVAIQEDTNYYLTVEFHGDELKSGYFDITLNEIYNDVSPSGVGISFAHTGHCSLGGKKGFAEFHDVGKIGHSDFTSFRGYIAEFAIYLNALSSSSRATLDHYFNCKYFNICDQCDLPTYSPTSTPTISPTSTPTSMPTEMPTFAPTKSPTSLSPTSSPTGSPTKSPSNAPTLSPTSSPTGSPTISPSDAPTSSPTSSPTDSPSKSPSNAPSLSPTQSPSVSPSTGSPTVSPSTKNPSTSIPTCSPSTGAPTSTPITDAPTTSLPTQSPTLDPERVMSVDKVSTYYDDHDNEAVCDVSVLNSLGNPILGASIEYTITSAFEKSDIGSSGSNGLMSAHVSLRFICTVTSVSLEGHYWIQEDTSILTSVHEATRNPTTSPSTASPSTLAPSMSPTTNGPTVAPSTIAPATSAPIPAIVGASNVDASFKAVENKLKCTVTVEDAGGNTVQGAQVYVYFQGPNLSWSGSGTTGGVGRTVITKSVSLNKISEGFGCKVTGITYAGYAWDGIEKCDSLWYNCNF